MATRSLITEYVKDTDGNYNSVEIHPITDSASVLTTTTQESGKNYGSYTGLPLETGSTTTTQETVLQSLLKTRSRLYELRAFNNVTINTSSYDINSDTSVPSSKVLKNAVDGVNTEVKKLNAFKDKTINTSSYNINSDTSVPSSKVLKNAVDGVNRSIENTGTLVNDTFLRIISVNPQYQFLLPNNKITYKGCMIPGYTTDTTTEMFYIKKSEIEEVQNGTTGLYHFSDKTGNWKIKITIYAIRKTEYE